MGTERSGRRPLAGWQLFAAAAVLSLVTMPITAIIFLVIGGLVVGAASAMALLHGSASMSTAHLVGCGLLVGPAVYLALAVVD